MKLKLDDNGHVVVRDGKPVYVHDDGKEIAFDAAGTVTTISRLNGEAKGHRERAEKAETALKGFEGITDAGAALKALETVKGLDAKTLVGAAEVHQAKAEAIKAVEEKYAPVLKERDDLKTALVSEKLGGAFARSKFIADKLAIPADLAQARFGESFRLEGGDVVAYDKAGNKLFSRARPGEAAGFDEALEILIEHYPYRDHIVKGSGASGGGAPGGGHARSAGTRTLDRAAFDRMAPEQRMAHVKAGGTVTD